MNEKKIFGVVIFTYEGWDEIETGYLQFYMVDFPFDSMKRYNGMDASLDMEGQLSITEKEGECKEVWKGFVSEIPEFMAEVTKKYVKER